MGSVLREIPLREKVSEWLLLLKINGFNDNHTFTEESFCWSGFDQLLIECEPFYYPCKAAKFLHGPMTMNRAMTILRQIVRPFGYTFRTRERLAHSKKYNEYFLTPDGVSLPNKPESNILHFE